MNDYEIIDEKSGISIEEQKEILTQINGIAEKNKQHLSQNNSALDKISVAARKKGGVFPLAVNIAAAVILAAGAFLLISFNGRIDINAREGAAVYNLTERALIEKIRKDTAEKIAVKELEMAEIASRLEEVDNELLRIYLNSLDLTLEQREVQESLLVSQNTFRAELLKLQDERAEILEDSRSREARIRAQMDERTREFASLPRSLNELDSAAKELEHLTAGQEKLSAINALLAGSLAVTGGQLQESQTDSGELNDLKAQNIHLQEKIDELQENISAGSATQDRRLGELEQSVTALRSTNSTLEKSITEKDRSISSLQTENTNLSSQVTDLRNVNAAQEQRITDLNNQITAIRALLQD
ncbi:MAG: hypothetical protein FWC22_02280 [Treponema sp.]|nr:hypothetical protein [Treponema sp.]